ncbi:uncharacterized protein LOC116292283 [Actinia tenebrosa]|uniref:Uncharacterized protein LOC116292283 n=1 Tax=Actinia tenebrosa TaxID=6105 RepID=A0A6P8HRU8_ACTTE|nr:uncharacterized protein LOC116292283 [Actinia tenebrosa]
MGQNISRRRRWRNLEQSTPEEQKVFVSDLADGFEIKPVSSKNRNVRKADHLMVYRYGYTHHLICVKVEGDRIIAMEYGPRNCFELSGKEALKLLIDVEKLGEVHRNSYTFEELEKIEMHKIVWPRELRRYRARKVVRRAISREGEKTYNCLTNNCEHFVMWCMCGLTVSLQVKFWYTWAKEIVGALCAGVTHTARSQLGSFFLKLLANASDEIAVTVLKEQNYAFAVGFAIASIMEAGLCWLEIEEAFENREKGVIKNDYDLNTKLLEIVAKVLSRLLLGAAGSLAGSAFGLPGSLAGGMIGAAVGNYLGAVVTRWHRDVPGTS